MVNMSEINIRPRQGGKGKWVKYCANCKHWKGRNVLCDKGHRNIVPYNISCDQHEYTEL